MELHISEDPKRLLQLIVQCEQAATAALEQPAIAEGTLRYIVETARLAWPDHPYGRTVEQIIPIYK